MYILYGILSAAWALYSYALVDPNITLINHPAWTWFRNGMVQLGYYARFESAGIFALLLTLSLIFHVLILCKKKTAPDPWRLALIIGGIVTASYPLLSHDVFNYLFSAKVLTYYHSNPWMHAPMDFPGDPWLRFMHWTHAPYPYGPTFLLFLLPPVFVSGGKFLIAYGLLKIEYLALYLLTVRVLARKNTQWALFFATSPIVLIEGMINMHNDLIAASFAIVGLVLLVKHPWWSRGLLLFSAGIKYTTAPLVLYAKKPLFRIVSLAGVAAVMIYLVVFIPTRIQPWYFLTLFSLLPLYYDQLKRYTLFFTGILYMYIYFLAFGEWSDPLKYQVAVGSLLITIVYNYIHGTQTKRT